jgi:type I restriction enzyme M protein
MFVRLEPELQSVENTVGTGAIRLPKTLRWGNELLTERHREIAGRIWEIANRLRGPYRPPQYRLVMLPMVVLRRLDCVLAPSKDAVIKEHARLNAAGTPASAVPRLLTKIVDKDRTQPLYNISPYTFEKLLADSENIAPNLVAYINGFSGTARRIFEKFKFSDQIEKLDSSNRLYAIVQSMAGVDLHPDRIGNIEMGYIFEHLVMRFNEQANEEAGDHFTPREVIRLMTHLVYTGEEDVYKPGVFREIYDPACGTGGMLSVSEETIRAGNARANLALSGQEYNDESWAICCSDMLIKDEETDNIVLGDTLGDKKTRDGFPGRQFHYLLANPPFGVEWKTQQEVVENEAKTHGFSGRFGAGLPPINDGPAVPAAHDLEDEGPAGAGRGRLQDRHRLQRLAPVQRRMPGPARPASGAGSSRTTGSTPSSPCRTSSSTTPASSATSGSSPTGSRPSGAARSS